MQEDQLMKQITILIVLALIATVISIVMGISSMTRGAAYDDKHSGQLMNARLIFQGIAALLLLIAIYAS
jgi:sugar phosphate permease